MSYSMDAIATIRSCYTQRFGIPRQPGLVESAVATIDFEPIQDNRLALRDLETFSHLWVVFVFHGQHYQRFKPLVQPPRLGGKKSMGVYATRSPNRPNGIGLSAVKLHGVSFDADAYRVHVGGGDFLDGTPVLDIKPYVPFVDAIPEASSEWATAAVTRMPVIWQESALEQLQALDRTYTRVQTGVHGLKTLIEETLAQDPRPAHERERDGKPGQRWGAIIGPVDVGFGVENGTVLVVCLTEAQG